MERALISFVAVALVSSGCFHRHPATQPEPPAATPTSKAAPAPVAKTPASTAKGKATAPAKTPPSTAKAPAATSARTSKPASVAKAPAPPTKPQPAPRPTAAPLDLEMLETQLRETKAIGVFTKLTLKNQVDDLLDRFREHYAGKTPPTMTDLRRSYDLLMMKVLSLLQDRDQKLAADIVSSRERIWGLLADPKKFAALTA
jgi:hypothetical protein